MIGATCLRLPTSLQDRQTNVPCTMPPARLEVSDWPSFLARWPVRKRHPFRQRGATRFVLRRREGQPSASRAPGTHLPRAIARRRRPSSASPWHGSRLVSPLKTRLTAASPMARSLPSASNQAAFVDRSRIAGSKTREGSFGVTAKERSFHPTGTRTTYREPDHRRLVLRPP